MQDGCKNNSELKIKVDKLLIKISSLFLKDIKLFNSDKFVNITLQCICTGNVNIEINQ